MILNNNPKLRKVGMTSNGKETCSLGDNRRKLLVSSCTSWMKSTFCVILKSSEFLAVNAVIDVIPTIEERVISTYCHIVELRCLPLMSKFLSVFVTILKV